MRHRDRVADYLCLSSEERAKRRELNIWNPLYWRWTDPFACAFALAAIGMMVFYPVYLFLEVIWDATLRVSGSRLLAWLVAPSPIVLLLGYARGWWWEAIQWLRKSRSANPTVAIKSTSPTPSPRYLDQPRTAIAPPPPPAPLPPAEPYDPWRNAR